MLDWGRMMNEVPPSSTQILGSGSAVAGSAVAGSAVASSAAAGSGVAGSAKGAPPTSIGLYSVIRVLGEGGMGTVYECHDTGLDRRVAVKVLKGELAADPEMRTRFLREARAMARVTSPHVVLVHAVGEDDGAPFIVMERLEGQDLSDRLQHGGPLSRDQLIAVLRDAAAGLCAAAQRGLVHRDVKPANLFIVNGRVKVTDFGLARAMDGSASVTQAGLIVGTPYYMAPELGRGAAASVASDIYALGATAFELLSGRPPYTGATPVEALAAHILEPTPRVLDACPHAGEELAAIIEKMLEKKPSARFTDYESLDDALRALAGISPTKPASIALAAKTATVPTPAKDTVAPPTPQPSNPSIRASGPQVAIKTKSLAIMLTDIAGYTERTSQQSREESARWLALHDDLLLPILDAFRGTLVKNIGDALLVTFTSPTDAVLCGCAIQDRLFQHNREASASDRIEVRIAISAGEVRVQRGDIFGEPVNLAARLEGIGERGEVLITDAVYATMNTAEVPLAPRGVHTFKGIQRAVHVYAAVPNTTPGALPFGGAALERAQAAQQFGARRIKTSLVDIGRRASDAAPRVISALRNAPRRVLIAAAIAAAVVAIIVVATSASERVEKQEQRQAEAAAGDELTSLIAALDAQHADDAKRRLVLATGKKVDDELKILTRNGTWWQRHHALTVLDERGVSVDKERFGIQDLREGSSCARRKIGLMMLKRVAASQSALDAVRDASRRQPDNACMLFDLPGVESAIRQRSKGAK